MKAINQIRGKSNRAVGEMFEDFLCSACTQYEMQGKAMIEKTPEPMKIIRRIANGRFECVFAKKAQPDYKGTFGNGQSIVFEAKHTDKDRIQQSRVTKDQSMKLDRYSSVGARCYVMVSLELRSFYLVPWPVWKNMKNLYKYKHMKKEDLKDFEVSFKGRFIDFLEGVKE